MTFPRLQNVTVHRMSIWREVCSVRNFVKILFFDAAIGVTNKFSLKISGEALTIGGWAVEFTP